MTILFIITCIPIFPLFKIYEISLLLYNSKVRFIRTHLLFISLVSKTFTIYFFYIILPRLLEIVSISKFLYY